MSVCSTSNLGFTRDQACAGGPRRVTIASILHGFDSFEGSPEAFDDAGGKYARGSFSTDGQVPRLDDPRAEIFKGWFNQTLPGYIPPDDDVLVINIDADLVFLDHLRVEFPAPAFQKRDLSLHGRHVPPGPRAARHGRVYAGDRSEIPPPCRGRHAEQCFFYVRRLNLRQDARGKSTPAGFFPNPQNPPAM